MNRFLVGQFSYTACEAAGPYSAVPGWKVKQVLPDFGGHLPEGPVKEAVRPFGSFRTPTVGPLATLAEIDQLPRCLRLDVLSGGFSSLAHLAAAGRDRSGRDAFFAHGLLVGPPGFGSTAIIGTGAVWNRYRPADFWDADGWLTPYRADAIEAAELGEPPMVSPAADDLDLRLDFIDLHPGQRDFVFAAAERALLARVPLVVVGWPVEAAMWTSMITHFLLPSVGWAVPFSTYEAGTADEVLRGGALVIGVPGEQAPTWQRVVGDVATVHDPTAPPGRDADGFTLPDGSRLPIGPWARLAEAVCRLGWEDSVRDAVDALGEQVGSRLDRWPLFALPAAVLTAVPEAALTGEPAVARLAADTVAAALPPASALPADLLAALVAASGRWGAAPVRATGDLLATLDRSGEVVSTDVTDPLLLGYARELLRPRVLRPDGTPWLPATITLSASARQQLAADLPDALGWIDAEPAAPAARCVLAAALLVDRLGLAGDPTPPDVTTALADRARKYLVPALFPDDPRAAPADVTGWPPLPAWLWRDVVVEEIVARLDGRRPGSLLRDPPLRQWIDAAAGPLPTTYVPGGTLAALTLVDGERAAAVLQTTNPNALGPDQREVLRVAAFHRAVHAGGQAWAQPRWLSHELNRWFPAPPPRPVLLFDLLAELPHDVPVAARAEFAADVLATTAPDEATAAIVERIRQLGLPPSELVRGPLAWHRQFAVPTVVTSHDLALPGAPANWPDFPETELLIAVASGQMRGPLRLHGVLRLAWWVLIVPAESLDLPGNEFRMESATWFSDAERDPFRTELDGLYPSVAQAILAGLDRSGEQRRMSADVLAAEWVVRAALAGQQISGDPARSFFADRRPDSTWSAEVRALLHPVGRPRPELENWLHRVTRSARAAADQAFPRAAAADDAARDALIRGALDRGSTLAGLGGLSGRLRRTPPPVGHG